MTGPSHRTPLRVGAGGTVDPQTGEPVVSLQLASGDVQLAVTLTPDSARALIPLLTKGLTAAARQAEHAAARAILKPPPGPGLVIPGGNGGYSA